MRWFVLFAVCCADGASSTSPPPFAVLTEAELALTGARVLGPRPAAVAVGGGGCARRGRAGLPWRPPPPPALSPPLKLSALVGPRGPASGRRCRAGPPPR